MTTSVHGKSARARRRRETIIPAVAPAVGQHQLPMASLGTITAITPDGIPLVSVAGGEPVAALMVAQIAHANLTMAQAKRSQVLLTFLEGDQRRPVIIGVIASNEPPSRAPAIAKVDGRRVELTGQDEVVLTCGKASITLTKAGKVLIKGTYVLSGSTGVNRVTGGSVQIN